jgi:putative polyhydroxyalkanoate system protein
MAKTLTVFIPHSLGAAEARRRLEHGLAKLGDDLPGGGLGDIKQTWTGDTLNFSAIAAGQTIAGAIQVLADKVKLDIDLPGLLGMFAGQIKRKIEERGQLLLK